MSIEAHTTVGGFTYYVPGSPTLTVGPMTLSHLLPLFCLVVAVPLEDSSNSLVRRAIAEKWSMYSLKEGLGCFPAKVLEYLISRGVVVKLNQPCRGLSFKDGLAVVRFFCCCKRVYLTCCVGK